MPLTTVAIELSNGKKELLYYPSNVVKDFFQENQELNFWEFVQLALNSLEEADKRVLGKFGYPCISCVLIKQKLLKWEEVVQRRNSENC